MGVPALGVFPASLSGEFRPLVAHAEQFHSLGHVFGLPNMVTHNVCESSPVLLGASIGDQLVVDLPREREISHAGIVDVPDLPAAEPVDGGRGNPKPALTSATASPLSADSWPAKHLVLDHLKQFVVHGSSSLARCCCTRRMSRRGTQQILRKYGSWPVPWCGLLVKKLAP